MAARKVTPSASAPGYIQLSKKSSDGVKQPSEHEHGSSGRSHARPFCLAVPHIVVIPRARPASALSAQKRTSFRPCTRLFIAYRI